MRNNQIRAGVSIDQTGSYGDKRTETEEPIKKNTGIR